MGTLELESAATDPKAGMDDTELYERRRPSHLRRPSGPPNDEDLWFRAVRAVRSSVTLSSGDLQSDVCVPRNWNSCMPARYVYL